MKIKVGILFGGNSDEREVSMLSYNEITNNIDKNKYEVIKLELPNDKSITWIQQLINNKPDIIFSALHGGNGENGNIQGLLECMDIPYVGSKAMASAISMDKKISKQIMQMNNIPVVDGIFIKKEHIDEIINFEEQLENLGYPLIVKPNSGGSSIGISIVNNFSELQSAIKIIENLYDDILIEKYINGKEVTCGVVETIDGLKVLALLDIDTNNEFYDYSAKYKDETTYIEFSALPQYLQVMIKEIARKVFLCLGCAGYGRVDMIVDDEQVYVLEMNTLPGLTRHSLIPKAATADGSFGELIDDLIEFELQKINKAVKQL